MNPETVKSINALIEVCKDGERGLRRCAARAEWKALAEVLGRHAGDCARSADEWQTVVLQHGADPERRGSVAGTLHRGWVGVRDALAPAGDAALLDECEREEDAMLQRYDEVLERAPLPEEWRALVARQLLAQRRNRDELRALRQAMPTATPT
jgi:uncharacterized protein (TIGR02284 family)